MNDDVEDNGDALRFRAPAATGSAAPRLGWPERLALSALVGVLILVVTILADWLTYRGRFSLADPQATTRAALFGFARALDKRIETGEALPQVLDELRPDELYRMSPYYGGKLKDIVAAYVDAWGHPLRYEANGTTYSLQSLGRDGRPGGSGFDADLGSDEVDGHKARASLLDFLREQPSEGMQETAGLSALLGFFIGVVLSGRRRTPNAVRKSLVVTAIATTLLAVVLSGAHIPFVSGH